VPARHKSEPGTAGEDVVAQGPPCRVTSPSPGLPGWMWRSRPSASYVPASDCPAPHTDPVQKWTVFKLAYFQTTIC